MRLISLALPATVQRRTPLGNESEGRLGRAFQCPQRPRILIASGAGVGRFFGRQPRAKISMMIQAALGPIAPQRFGRERERAVADDGDLDKVVQVLPEWSDERFPLYALLSLAPAGASQATRLSRIHSPHRRERLSLICSHW